MPTRLARRDAIKGISLGAGAAFLGPVLHSIQARAAGSTSLPLRLVVILQANGFHPWAAQPKGIERTDDGPTGVVDKPLSDFELSDDLSPLQPYKENITIIQRLSARHTQPWHSALFSALSAMPREKVSDKRVQAESIDAAFARLHPGPLPLVNLGVAAFDKLVDENGLATACSAWGKDKPIGTQSRPDLAFRGIFGAAAAKALDEEGGLLDHAQDDVRRIRKDLTAEDREALERYLAVFESLDARKLATGKLAAIDRKRHAPRQDEQYTSAAESDRLASMYELAGASLISGITNVATICDGLCNTNGVFEGLGFPIKVHPLGHFQDVEGRPWKDTYTMMRQVHMRHIAGLVKKLRAIPEGDGTIMDRTLILYTSDGAETHHSKGDEWPFLLIGDLAGGLRSGRFLEYPAVGNEGNRLINSLYCALLNAAGQMRGNFNATEELVKIDTCGPLFELLS